jgi:non-ribosomal peptide synthetase component F
MLSDEAGELKGALLYDTDLFEEATMVRMAEHFLTVLESAASDPDRPLSTIRVTGEAHLRQLTSAFSEDF